MTNPKTKTNSIGALSGTILESRYELGRVLGSGGMGAVFEARHIRLDRKVAIKVLQPAFAGHEDFIKRFLREAKAASKIRHRNIVEIHDYGETGAGLIYSVMEFLGGRDLDQLVQAQPDSRLPWDQACMLMAQAAAGLRAAHAEGIIHRDIKPANCFVTSDEDQQPLVKVVDFGIARVDDADQTQQLTSTAEVLGTPGYIAPELVMSKTAASPHSDIYSFGVLAYRLLTGYMPFNGETAFHVLHRACFDPVPPPGEYVPGLPRGLEHLVLRMLAKSPTERPSCMDAVRRELVGLASAISGSQTMVLCSASSIGLPSDDPKSATNAPKTTPLPRDIGSLRAMATRRSEVQGTEILPIPAGFQAPEFAVATMETATSTNPSETLRFPLRAPAHSPAASVSIVTRAYSDPGQAHMARSRHGLWLGVGGLAVGVAIGGLVFWSVSAGDHDSAAAPETITPSALPRPAVAISEPSAVARLGSKPQAAFELEPLSEPEGTAAPAARPIPDPKLDFDNGAEPHASGQRAPRSVRRTDGPIRTPASGSAASHPPSDAALEKRLVRKIRSRCVPLAEGQPIWVSFIVLRNGKLSALQAKPKGPAASCSLGLVRRMKYGKRIAPTVITFSVKQRQG